MLREPLGRVDQPARVCLSPKRRLNVGQVTVWVALDMADQHHLNDHLRAEGLTAEQRQWNRPVELRVAESTQDSGSDRRVAPQQSKRLGLIRAGMRSRMRSVVGMHHLHSDGRYLAPTHLRAPSGDD